MNSQKRFWSIRNEADETAAELMLYGEIANETWYGDEVTPKQFAEDIRSLGGKPLVVRVNSPGGDVFAAQAIYSQLKSYTGSVTAYIDGMAASAATVITCAADKVIMPDNAIFMIHNPMVGVCDYLDEGKIKEIENQLSAVKQTIVNAYLKKCSNVSESKLKKMMDAETWMTAQEAQSYGFVDELEDSMPVENTIHNGMVYVSKMSYSLDRFKNKRQLESVLALRGKDDANMGETGMMSILKEIKDLLVNKQAKETEVQPDLVALERQRMIDLDALCDGNKTVAKIVDIAKKNGNSAEEIREYVDAVKAEAAKPNKDKGLEEIKNLIKDQMNSGTANVRASVSTKQDSHADSRKMDIENIVAAMKSVRGE